LRWPIDLSKDPRVKKTYITSTFEDILCELSHNDLNDKNENPDDNEHPVSKHSGEHVQLISYFSGIEHIENLHEDEGSENHSHVSTSSK
jgi:hypothetical protein